MLKSSGAWNVSTFINVLMVWSLGFSSVVLGQGTIAFGFEEFPVGSTPLFVDVGSRGYAEVADSTTPYPIQPFEGQKFLMGSGQIRLASPDGRLIESFTIHIFGMGPNEGSGRPFVNVGNVSLAQLESWQIIQGSFGSPVPYIQISAFNFETSPTGFGIDSVQFVTIPEPQTLGLLACGLSILYVRKFRRRKANSA
ncbi:MAG TPA: hypothetical protein VM260_01270 [Pirellula sp.]|nr:hypothetical protein [Pirellula sp.]